MSFATNLNEAPQAGCLAQCLVLYDGFKNANEASLNLGEVAPRFTEHAVAARQPFFSHAERIKGIPIICHGWAAAVTILPDKRRQIIALLLPGDLVSGALVFEDKLEFAVEAITDVTYHCYDRVEFHKALLANARLLEIMIKALSKENSRSVQLAVSLGQCTAEERIVRLLKSLAERLAQRHLEDNNTFPFPLRQRHIAEITGLTEVHVNRVINLLRRAGMIDIRKRLLTIRDPAAFWRSAGL